MDEVLIVIEKCKQLKFKEIEFLKKQNLNPAEYLLRKKGPDYYEFYHIQTGRKLEIRRWNAMDNMYQYRYEASKPKVIDTCQECGYDIYEGQEYYDIYGKILCDECVENFKKFGGY